MWRKKTKRATTMQFSNLQAVEKTERQFEILRLCHGAMLTMLKTNNTKAGQGVNHKMENRH